MSASQYNIFLVRHGRPDLPEAEYRFLGRRDVPLGVQGIAQARRAAESLRGIEFSHAYSTGLMRTDETARIILEGREVPLTIEPRLAEIDCGLCDGLSFPEAKKRFPDFFEQRNSDLYGCRAPEGESFADVEERAVPAFMDIVGRAEGNLLVVAHAGVIRVLLNHVLGMPKEGLFSFHQPYCAISVLGTSPRHGLTLRALCWLTPADELF